jgi:RecA-family ATPase
MLNTTLHPIDGERDQVLEPAPAFDAGPAADLPTSTRVDRVSKPRAATSNGVPDLVLTTARQTSLENFAPLKWVVPGIIPEGLALLVAKPKIGKTWLAMDFALSVSMGGFAMGEIECEQGDVLFMALEDNRRRLKRRYDQLLPSTDKPERLSEALESRRIDKGLVDQIRGWIGSVAKPRLVIIDTLQMIRPLALDKRSAFQAEYETLAPLRTLAHEFSIAILVVHHMRKSDADDILDTVSGTLGLNAAADTIVALGKQKTGFVMAARGRDVDGFEKAVAFSKGRWKIEGNASDVHRTKERKQVLDTLAKAREKLSASEVAAATGQTKDAARKMLDRLMASGEVTKSGARYALAPEQDDIPF